jgi:uncharacterized membrane protein YjjP (DUF1212 family)
MSTKMVQGWAVQMYLQHRHCQASNAAQAELAVHHTASAIATHKMSSAVLIQKVQHLEVDLAASAILLLPGWCMTDHLLD